MINKIQIFSLLCIINIHICNGRVLQDTIIYNGHNIILDLSNIYCTGKKVQYIEDGYIKTYRIGGPILSVYCGTKSTKLPIVSYKNSSHMENISTKYGFSVKGISNGIFFREDHYNKISASIIYDNISDSLLQKMDFILDNVKIEKIKEPTD